LVFDTPDVADLFQISKTTNDLQHIFSQLIEKQTLFRTYYQFKHFYWHCEHDFARAMINALDHENTELWEAKYRLWFFNELLLEKEVELGEFPTDDSGLNNIRAIDQKIDQQQGTAIRDIWHFHQREIMKSRTLQSVRLTFNLRGNNTFSKRNSLRYLMHEEFDLMTTFFPVILVNPSVSSSIFPLKRGLFDLVIFDEASQLRLEDTYPALLRGRFQIISGDIHQMPPSSHFSNQNAAVTGAIDELEDDVVYSEEESLLTFAQNADYEFNYLDFHYRSQHPHLIDFSNAAFYGKRLVPMPPSSNRQPIMMREVTSVYQDNTNPGEADEILKILFEEIQPDAQGNYPSIGVATLNLTQQRYLWERIWTLADQDEAIRSKLAKLESAGFFIKNLENIQGDQRDIVIISTTFGVRPDGKFIQNFGPLNQDKGYKLLNVIVTRAKQQIYLVTSIPSEFYSNYREDILTKGNTGKGIFYAYLNYAKFCSEGNENAREELLNFLMHDQQQEAKPTVSTANFLTESPFEEEVVLALLELIPNEFVKTQFQMGGFRLDIVVKNKAGMPAVVIECDGKAYHSSKVAYRYDIHRQNILERHGLHVYRIWSTNWWRERDREILKMKRMLEEQCKDLFEG
jgi:very-short-patch-repair endonuclease